VRQCTRWIVQKKKQSSIIPNSVFGRQHGDVMNGLQFGLLYLEIQFACKL
jgi:hypothetical protein